MVDDIGVGIGGQRLGGTIGGNVDGRGGQEWVARNSSAVGMLFLRVNKVSSFQTRLSADLCWRTVVSSSSSSEGKRSDDGWF